MKIKNIRDSEGDFIKRSYTFLGSEGKIMTRSFTKPETAKKFFESEIRKLRIKIQTVTNPEEKRAFEESLCDLTIALSNCRGPYAHITFRREPTLEIR